MDNGAIRQAMTDKLPGLIARLERDHGHPLQGLEDWERVALLRYFKSSEALIGWYQRAAAVSFKRSRRRPPQEVVDIYEAAKEELK